MILYIMQKDEGAILLPKQGSGRTAQPQKSAVAHCAAGAYNAPMKSGPCVGRARQPCVPERKEAKCLMSNYDPYLRSCIRRMPLSVMLFWMK